MDSEERNRPASPETIKNLTVNLLQTIESTYHEMYVDMVLTEALRQGVLDEEESVDRDYLEKVIRVHANVCYVVFSLCVQCRASLKSSLNVEKQYDIRRSVVTGHEMYKYLYGFTGRTTPWKEIEPILSAKYPEKSVEIAAAADEFLQKYAKEADGTLRDVSKHFSDNPTEFFQYISRVSERNVAERIGKALGFIQPIHSLLVKELQDNLGKVYFLAWAHPMPIQKLNVGSISQNDKIDALRHGLEEYGGILESVMRRLDVAEKFCKEHQLDMTQNKQWVDLTENNIGLHVLYIYLDSLTTFLAFCRSECFAEYRQNLAYLVISTHEGFKKLYGFDENKRSETYWNRAVKQALIQSDDELLAEEAERIERKLEELSTKTLLKDEDMIAAFTHVGTIKKMQTESTFAVLDYFRKDVKKEDLDVLTEYLIVLNDIIRLYNKVMKWESERSKQERELTFAGYFEQIDKIDKLVGQNAKDDALLAKWRESSEKMREMLRTFEKMLS